MKYGGMCVLKWFVVTLCIGGTLSMLPLEVSAGSEEPMPKLFAQAPVQSSQALSAMETGPQVIPAANNIDRETSGQRLSIESTSLESLLLEKGVITQEDWIRLKAEEERRIFEQSAELQMAGNPRWYERIRVTGYMQFKYNMGATDRRFDIPLNDSFGDQQGNEFYARRLRLVFQGQVSERVAFFMQFALEGGQQELSNREIIDAYSDFYLTKDKVHRIRWGLHRVPNAFDTYRSSTNRQEMDRHESVQSGAPGERDLGIAYYWSQRLRRSGLRNSRPTITGLAITVSSASWFIMDKLGIDWNSITISISEPNWPIRFSFRTGDYWKPASSVFTECLPCRERANRMSRVRRDVLVP